MAEIVKHSANGTNGTSQARQEQIDKILRKIDVRSSRWEYFAILNTLQNLPNSSIQDLLNEINTEYGCEMFSYNSLWNNVKSLQESGVISANNIDKLISVKPEYIINDVKYLPVSNYCVAIFLLSVISLIGSFFFSYNIGIPLTFVISGAVFMVGQYFGSEFKFNK